MTKPRSILLFILILLCNVVNAQCDFSDPLKGLTIENATFLSGDVFNGYMSKLPAVSSPGIQPNPLCSNGGTPDNIVWYSFIPTAFAINISITYTNCTMSPFGNGIQTGIYGDLAFTEEVACNTFPAGSPLSLTASGLTPGKMYYLFVDGADGVICDFKLNVISGISTAPLTFNWQNNNNAITAIQSNTSIQLNQNVCSNADSLYTYIAPTCIARSGAFPLSNFDEIGLYCFEWTISPPIGGTIIGDPNAKQIEVDWQVPGDYTLNVNIIPNPDLTTFSNSLCTNTVPISVTVKAVTQTISDTIFICPGSPELFCGELIDTTTTRECLQNFGTCESIVQPFVLLPMDTIDMGTVVVCSSGSNCFSIFGFDYCNSGIYVINDPNECNVRHKFKIESFVIDINLPATMELDCSVDELLINPNLKTNYIGPINYRWEENGSFYQADSVLGINRKGTFTFIVEFPNLGPDCFGSSTIEIKENVNAPNFDLIIPTINCDTPVGFLDFVEIDPIDSLSWEGTNSFQSNLPRLLLNSGGSFTIFVKGENGCIADSTFTVTEDREPALITLSYQNLDCVIESTTAKFSADRDARNIEWTRPDLTNSNVNDFIITDPGNYTFTFTADNGCQTAVPFLVQENVNYPFIEAGLDQEWQCNTETLNLNGQIEAGTFDVSWNFVEQGQILSDPKSNIIEIGSPGRYVLKVTNEDNGCTSRDSVNVLRNEDIPKLLETSIIDPSCYQSNDAEIQIVNVNGGTRPYKYFIDGEATENNETFIQNLSAGSYTIMIKDIYDCELVEEIIVSEKLEIIIDSPPFVEIGYNANFIFEAIHNLSDQDVSGIYWYDENNNLIGTGPELEYIGVVETTIYVEVINQNGCSAVRSIPIRIDVDIPVYAPNVFSPNEDGLNDVFTIYTRDYPGYVESLRIFDRWGELMYAVDNLDFNDLSKGWDGTKNGKALESAVYTYMAKIKLVDDSYKIIGGDVTLIR